MLVIFDKILHNSASAQPGNLRSGPAILIWYPASFGDDGEVDFDVRIRDGSIYFFDFSMTFDDVSMTFGDFR